MDPLQWMGAVRIKVQTADKNITIITLNTSSSQKVHLSWISHFWLHKMLADGLEWCGLLWCFYQLFGLSFWRHPFTTDDPLLSKWCDATFLQIRWRNKLICKFNGMMVNTFSTSFPFSVKYSCYLPGLSVYLL